MDGIKIISKKEYLKNNKKPEQEDVWDNISELWSEFKKKPFFKIEDFLKGKKGKVIDLGCGSGRNMVSSPDIEYYGVDFSDKQLKNAEEYVKNNKIKALLFKQKINDLSIFKDEMFDYGLFIATLHCIETEPERENALKEFYRVLKKGGEGLISVWNSEDKRFNGLSGDIYMSWRKDGKEHMRYYYLFSKDEFIDLLKKVGFKILEFHEKEENNDSRLMTSSSRDRFSKKNWNVKVKK